ncbi:glycosyltransferase family 2 protein [Arthrobacter globiformis]|uniref:glycosyltransferase family 2 protein n=1 Tax=Arthrobacter globiformis TaxID=1665 RepID=UPI0027844861|nr:glycosyltransferase [Arthrobacter globiformis]MDQ0865811.1 glycosyltransferase involved in cell wall biosynthesis [Arthrobacter globiformis]
MSKFAAEAVDVSVVIGFKDWGVERLFLAVSSLVHSFGDLVGEVIVSDYGSRECPDLKEQIEALGARYVYTETNGVWSRSRALNAGFAISRGRVLVSTDADMLFSPRSMEIIGRRILSDPSEALVLQCRDLPSEFDSEGVVSRGLDWAAFEASSTFRPRWGMGGMMAVSRHGFLTIRGFDERMEIYGGEDMDFAQRLRWAGQRLSWLEHPDVRMYHMWHPSTRTETDKSPEGRAAIALNRDIVLNDKSYIRNVVSWAHRPSDALPLASVVISTKNRAEFIAESVNSVLAQTVSDIEVVIVDDGSTDNTAEVIASFEDPRIRYFKREASGIAASRNFAASVSRARFTVVHDDDDLMFPDRIENHFNALHGGISGTYGGWIDFDNETGNVVSANPGKSFSYEAILFSGRIYAHATLMIETSLIRLMSYDEKLRSGSDFNLAIRLGRCGVSLKHTGHFHLIRRIHSQQVTTTDSGHQKSAARRTLSVALSAIPAGRQNALRKEFREHPLHLVSGHKDPAEWVKPYLPDHLVQRDISMTLSQVENVPPVLAGSHRLEFIDVRDHMAGGESSVKAVLYAASWAELAALRSAGIDFELASSRYRDEEAGAPIDLGDPIAELVASLPDLDSQNYVVVKSDGGVVPLLDAPIVADKTVIDREKKTSVRIHTVSGDFEWQRLFGAWQADESLEIEIHQAGVLPGSTGHLALLEGLTK